MSKRITVVLDDVVVDGIRLLEGQSVSSKVNEALRKAIHRESQRQQTLSWVQSMNTELGRPSPTDFNEADRLLEESGFGRTPQRCDE